MKQILIATHGKMASGIRYTAELIVGKMDEITTIDAYVTPDTVGHPLGLGLRPVQP